MSREPAILARIREALESLLAPGEAARVLVEALARWGPRVPADAAEVASFVEGPLSTVLAARAGDGVVVQLLVAVDEILATVSAPTTEHRFDPEVEIDVQTEWLDEITKDLPRAVDAPVPVLVVAGGIGLASRLRAAMGIDRIAALTRTDRAGIERALTGEPLLAIVDATDVPRIGADELAPLLSTPGLVRAVWGADLTYGRRFVELCERDRRACVGVRIADGMEAILDLVASRRG